MRARSVANGAASACKRLEAYQDSIPVVLLALSAALREEGGLSTPGIMRPCITDQEVYSAYEQELQTARDALCAGTFSDRRWPVQVIAGLIKLWFRQLPTRLLKLIRKDVLSDGRVLTEPLRAEAAVDAMPDPFRSLLQWLLDLLAVIVQHEHGPPGHDGTAGGTTAADNGNGADASGTGISAGEAAKLIVPLLISLVDFRLLVHGSDHTVPDGLSASESVLDFFTALIESRVHKLKSGGKTNRPKISC